MLHTKCQGPSINVTTFFQVSAYSLLMGPPATSKDLEYLHTCGKWSWDSIDAFLSLIWPNLAEILVCACSCVKLCTVKGLACFPVSIDTLIILFWPNLAEIMACACNDIGCIHANVCAQVTLCAQRGLACSPDSVDTLITLIWSNLTKIWACAQKKNSMHAC